jgi:hypothetical protein
MGQSCQGAEISPQIPKGAAKKSEGPEKLAAEFLPDFHEKGRKGAELFRNSCLRDNLWSLLKLVHFYPNLILIFS